MLVSFLHYEFNTFCVGCFPIKRLLFGSNQTLAKSSISVLQNIRLETYKIRSLEIDILAFMRHCHCLTLIRQYQATIYFEHILLIWLKHGFSGKWEKLMNMNLWQSYSAILHMLKYHQIILVIFTYPKFK